MPAATVTSTQAGWHGKLPAAGDFVNGGARLELITAIERWAMAGMVEIRAAGGPSIDAFLTAPLFRLATGPGIFGAAPGLAVLGPGMDRSGRPYPFVIAMPLCTPAAPKEVLRENRALFEALEAVFLAALAPDYPLDRLAEDLAGLPAPLSATGAHAAAETAVIEANGTPVLQLRTPPTPAQFAALFRAGPSIAAGGTAA
ncbi:MAG: type VI secretion system-associated protein TagF [Pseudomonadota bacterium]